MVPKSHHERFMFVAAQRFHFGLGIARSVPNFAVDTVETLIHLQIAMGSPDVNLHWAAP